MTWETKVPKGATPGMRDRGRQGPNQVGSTLSNEGSHRGESVEQEGKVPTPCGGSGVPEGALGRQRAPTVPTQSSVASQIFHQGAVVTDAARCTSLGIEVLSKQGSSVDAAVAAALCLGIVAPHSSGLGG